MHIFISAGEPSGDQHAAQLVTALRERHPDLHISGFGGPELAQAGQQQLYRLTDLAVMGVMAVLPLIRKFWALYQESRKFFSDQRPDAVLLVDFPGFNWWIAKAAKRAGIPVYYYCPPQLWAWASWRIRKVRKFVDCVLSVLPFEAQWYRDKGIDVEYVGHPFFDEVAHHEIDQQVVGQLKNASPRRVAVLPGSRKQEVNRNFPMMLGIVRELHHRHPDVRFPVACYKQWHLNRCRELVEAHGADLPIDLYVGKTSEVIEAADCCFMVSGSVSLELLARRKPGVVVYRGGAAMAFFARLLITCKYMTLPNLIAGRAVMPEFPCVRMQGRHVTQMKDTLNHWLSDPSALQASRDEIEALAESVVQAGGISRCADVLLQRLTESPTSSQPTSEHLAA